MKYPIVTFFFIFLLTACGNDSSNKNMLLRGEVDGLKKGNLWLQKLEDTLFVSVDSLEVDGVSAFNFSEEIIDPEVYYLAMSFQDSSDVIKRVPFFAEAGNLTIHTTLKNYERDAVITGSANQAKLDEYKKLMTRFNNQNLELIEEGLNAMKDGDDSLATVAQEKQNRLFKGTYLASVNFAKNNSDYEVAPYIMLTQVSDINVTYLDTIYGSLSPKIKDSKYGKALESYIETRKGN